MKTYYFRFYGRQNGAIGILMYYNAEVKAENYDQALLKLYDRYEHISVNSYSEWEDK